jgi:hypothetical protein
LTHNKDIWSVGERGKRKEGRRKNDEKTERPAAVTAAAAAAAAAAAVYCAAVVVEGAAAAEAGERERKREREVTGTCSKQNIITSYIAHIPPTYSTHTPPFLAGIPPVICNHKLISIIAQSLFRLH